MTTLTRLEEIENKVTSGTVTNGDRAWLITTLRQELAVNEVLEKALQSIEAVNKTMSEKPKIPFNSSECHDCYWYRQELESRDRAFKALTQAAGMRSK